MSASTRFRLSAGLVAALLAAPAALGAGSDPGTEEQRAKGAVLYDKYCAQCHGETGDGKGHATPRVKPQPRDFTSGKYKFRSTPNGKMPTDADIARAIREGLPYTTMPAWPSFSDQQVRNLVYYLKTFSADFENPDKLADPIDIPQPPPSTPESIAKGREVYEAQGCGACHGDLGRGDGPSARTLTDDWGHHIRPADMTLPWTFRGGSTAQDIFRTFSTGLNGTPMPSYGDTLPVEDRWNLIHYIRSLSDGDDPRYDELLVVKYLADELDLDRADELFAGVVPSRFPLVGQIMQPGRDFYASAVSVDVEAVYNQQEIAFRVSWNDMSAETSGTNAPDLPVPLWDEEHAASGAAGGEDDGGFWGEEEAPAEEDPWGDAAMGDEEEGDFWGEEDDLGGAGSAYADAVALQFPSALTQGPRKPYFIFGDGQSPVDLWFAEMATGVARQYVGRGSDALEPSLADDIDVRKSYDNGRWTVLFKRSLRGRGGVDFAPERFVPLAFSVWDGFNEERGNKRALSAWFNLYVEPMQKVSAVGPMVKAGLATLLVEILLVVWIRRKYAKGEPASPRSSSPGTMFAQRGGAT